MELYHWVMIVFGGLSISGSLIYFAVQVLRYLWRIEQAIESLVKQNEVIMSDNKKRDERISFLESRFEIVESADKSARQRFLAG